MTKQQLLKELNELLKLWARDADDTYIDYLAYSDGVVACHEELYQLVMRARKR